MKTTLLFCILAITQGIYAQVTTLDHNNTSITISNSGTVFSNSNGAPGYEVPKGSGMHTINSTQFWFAAKTSSGEIRTALGGAAQQGTDVFPGAYSYPHNYDAAYNAEWGTSVWTICQSDIDNYVLWWECEHGIISTGCDNVEEPSITIMQLIYDWPAHGNTVNGEDEMQAPFFDYNQDGVYDPANGDVPKIKGCCATYMIQNDDNGIHTHSGTEPIGLEMHYMFYHYKTYDYLNNTTFVEVTAKNTGPNDYVDFTYGIIVDPELGNPTDNYFGCDSTSNTMYFYNADNDDQNFYGVDPPAFGVVGLDHQMMACVADPSTSSFSETWYAMNGLQPSSAPIMHPDGYATKFMFSDDPNDPSGWSQYTTGSTNGQNGLMTFNHGPINGQASFGGGQVEEVKQTYAILYARGGDHLENVTQLLQDAVLVKDFHDNDSDIPCEGAYWAIDELEVADFSIYPNPTSGQLFVDNNLNLNMQVSLLNVEGKSIIDGQKIGTSAFFDVSSLNAGVYFIQIETESGNVMKRVIIE